MDSRLPAGPRGPALWQSIRYLTRPNELFDECFERYGEMFTLRLVGSGRWVFVASPRLARELFTASPDVLQAGVMNYSVWGSIAGSRTVFTMDSEAHLKRRRLLLPPFHGDQLRARVPEMVEITTDVTKAWEEGARFPIQHAMQQITLGVLARTAFGQKAVLNRGKLMDLLVRVTDEIVGSWLLLAPALQQDWGRHSPWGRICELIRDMDTALFEEIEARRTSGDRDRDLLSVLLDVRDEDGEPLPDTDIRDELITMLMAGHDTTETELTWAFELILAHNPVLARIRDELDLVVGDREVRSDDLPKLEYLDAAIDEAMRVRPLAPHVAFRRLASDYEIGGYQLPAGTIVSNAVRLLHRRKDLYERPREFDPNRFLTEKIDPYQYAPFGGGTRRCIGMQFALTEMKVVLATILGSFEFELLDAPGRTARSGFFVVPRKGVRVRAFARS